MVPIMLVVGGLVVGMALWLELAFEPPLWLHAVVWIPCITGLVLAVLPMTKGVNIALQHRYRSTDENIE